MVYFMESLFIFLDHWKTVYVNKEERALYEEDGWGSLNWY